ncbi:hypothetical protein CEQ90_11520 [Lewinellaceae bacterium SD302]|nr:hypothetical protein CEQ90_11520 [Lewinellaceae bacterium SD302]
MIRSGFILVILLFSLTTIIYCWAEWQNLDLLTDPKSVLTEASYLTITASFSLLAADAFLPTPSSAVMVVNGLLFSLWPGLLLSVIGLMAGNAAGFLVARRGKIWLEKKFPQSKRKGAETFWKKWGAIALIISRPIPVLAESILFLSATTSLSFGRVMLYCLLGTVPTALVYVMIGCYVAQ